MFDPSPGPVFTVVLIVFGILFVAVVVLMITVTVRRAKKFRDAGIDPLDPQADMAIRLMQRGGLAGMPPQVPGPAAPPPPSLTQRLAELDALHRAGTITADERDAARAKLLGTL